MENLERVSDITTFNDIFDLARAKENTTVAVAAAASAYVMKAAAEASRLGIAKMILVGCAAKMEEVAAQEGLDLSVFEIVDEADNFAACRTAVRLVVEGRATALMKGDVDTSSIMRAALDRENGMRDGKKLSHIAAFEPEHYHKLLFVSDCAINIAPDGDTKIEIIENCVRALHSIGIEKPKVALLAAKEVVDEKMPITATWAGLVTLHKTSDRMNGCIIDGPLALDNAVSKDACEIKGINSPVGGDADVLIVPDIEAGNILYKSLSFITKARNGGVVVGAKRPIILTSRADTAESKLISIALSVLF